MENKLQTQLKNVDELKNVLLKVNKSFKLKDDQDVSTLLIYMPFESGKCNHIALLEEIKNGLLENFAFSCSEVEKKLGISSKRNPTELFEKALRKLSKKTAQGELGELLLFTLLEIYIGAPKILSKISMKTNPKMAVHGADAVHCQVENNQLRIYLGESKLYTNFNDAAYEAVKSIKTSTTSFQQEFDLLDSFMDFKGISESIKNELLTLLNPFNNTDVDDKLNFPCFIGFSDPGLISSCSNIEEFEKKYSEIAKNHIETFYSKVLSNSMNVSKTTLMILPYTCVNSFVNDFIEYIGISQ